jgi:filamin
LFWLHVHIQIQSKIGHRYDVKDFTGSWADGIAIAELVEALKPGQLDNSNLASKRPIDNATLAEDLAEQNMGIPQLCAPEDLIAGENADELSNMTYLSLFRDYDKRMNAAAEEEAKRRTADAGQCVAYGPGLEGGQTYQPARFTIEARNCYGDRLQQGGDVFVVTVKAPKNKQLNATIGDNNDGTYSVQYDPVDAGVHWIGVTLKNKPIRGHPWQPHITRAEASAQHSTVSGPGVEPGNEAGKPTHFLITARDVNGVALPTGGDPFVATITGPWGGVQSNLKDNSNGTYTVDYTPKSAGTYNVSVTLKNVHVDKSVYKVFVLLSDSEADATQCYAEGPGLAREGLKSNQPTEFTIHARNSKGASLKIDPNRHHFNVDIIAAVGTKEESSFSPTKYTGNPDGSLQVHYTPTLSGTYRIDIELHDPRESIYYDHIKDSPFTVIIKPSADASTTEVTGPGIQDGIKDTEGTWFDVITKDAQGKPIKEGGEDVGCTITGPDGKEIPAKLTDKGDGTYHIEYQPSGPGRHTIVPTVRGKPIKQAPIHVNVIAGTSAGNSFIEGFSFKIRAADLRGQPKTTGGDNFAVQILDARSGQQVKDVKVADNKDGSYTCNYGFPRDTAPGTEFSISVTLNGAHIHGSPWKQHC